MGRSSYTRLYFDQSDVDDPDGLICRCLALSDDYLACGFADGTVRLFDLATLHHVSTYRPHQRDRLGRFPRAITGIVISGDRLTFATLDGDIHVAMVPGPPITRRAHLGDVVTDGALLDFTGCGRRWVGLYAGVPGRAIRIWDSNTEELVFVGWDLTDPEAVMGWHMLNELTEFVGRVRAMSHGTAVACTGARVLVFDLRNGAVLADERYPRGIIVTSVDVSDDAAYVIVGNRGLARVRRVDTLQEMCRFMVGGAGQMGAMGCMNGGYALMCTGGAIRVWEVERGVRLNDFQEHVGQVNAFVCDERHVAAYCSDTTLHLWDFGAQE